MRSSHFHSYKYETGTIGGDQPAERSLFPHGNRRVTIRNAVERHRYLKARVLRLRETLLETLLGTLFSLPGFEYFRKT
jgi:hypothetical protein